jgi:hypothetical protein
LLEEEEEEEEEEIHAERYTVSSAASCNVLL